VALRQGREGGRERGREEGQVQGMGIWMVIQRRKTAGINDHVGEREGRREGGNVQWGEGEGLELL